MGWEMIFDGWAPLGRTAVLGTLAYVALVLVLRISGKRTLSKMNAFDFVVTVALGSTLATVLLSKDVSLAQGFLALALLILLQLAVTWTSVRSARFFKLVKSEPRLLLYRGRFLEGAMKDERIADEEVRAAMRSQGIGALSDVEAVVLETDGTISVVRSMEGDKTASFENVHGFPPGDQG